MSFPSRLTAAVLVEQRSPLVLASLAPPVALEVGQVLVRVRYSGICGSQLGEIDGVKGEDRYLPHLLGHEGSGEVVAIGPGVRHVAPGEKVVLHWRKGQGIDAPPPRYGWDGRTVNAGWVTTFNNWAVVSENRLTHLPAEADLRIAALLGCAVTTGFGVITNNARVTIGESVVVFGAGGVGLNIVQAAALCSAYPIIAVDRFDNRLALAETLGATHRINTRTEDARARILGILGQVGADVFVENTGSPEVIELGYEITKPQGRVVLVGVPRQGAKVALFSLPLHFGKKLTGSHGGEALPERDIPRYEALYRHGRLRLDPLLTETFPLAEINKAIGRMRDGSLAGRCLIAM